MPRRRAIMQVRCVAYNVGASSPQDFTAGQKWDDFNLKVTRMTKDFATFHTHQVGLALICELDEAHHERFALPQGWKKIGAGEFMLAMAPGWTVNAFGLKRVYPDEPFSHPKKGWRVFFEAGGSTEQQQQAAGGSRRQSESSKQRGLAGR